MELSELRKQIDCVDEQLVNLFCQRMEIAANVAAYKRANNMPIYIPEREKEKLNEVSNLASPGMELYTRSLYNCLFELSRTYQKDLINTETEV